MIESIIGIATFQRQLLTSKRPCIFLVHGLLSIALSATLASLCVGGGVVRLKLNCLSGLFPVLHDWEDKQRKYKKSDSRIHV
jgi:hypothetical protein